jgi:hypothetical protein
MTSQATRAYTRWNDLEEKILINSFYSLVVNLAENNNRTFSAIKTRIFKLFFEDDYKNFNKKSKVNSKKNTSVDVGINCDMDEEMLARELYPGYC